MAFTDTVAHAERLALVAHSALARARQARAANDFDAADKHAHDARRTLADAVTAIDSLNAADADAGTSFADAVDAD